MEVLNSDHNYLLWSSYAKTPKRFWRQFLVFVGISDFNFHWIWFVIYYILNKSNFIVLCLSSYSSINEHGSLQVLHVSPCLHGGSYNLVCSLIERHSSGGSGILFSPWYLIIYLSIKLKQAERMDPTGIEPVTSSVLDTLKKSRVYEGDMPLMCKGSVLPLNYRPMKYFMPVAF